MSEVQRRGAAKEVMFDVRLAREFLFRKGVDRSLAPEIHDHLDALENDLKMAQLGIWR